MFSGGGWRRIWALAKWRTRCSLWFETLSFWKPKKRPSQSMRSFWGSHGVKGGLRRSPTARRAAAAARTSGKRREGWSVRRLWIGIML